MIKKLLAVCPKNARRRKKRKEIRMAIAKLFVSHGTVTNIFHHFQSAFIFKKVKNGEYFQ